MQSKFLIKWILGLLLVAVFYGCAAPPPAPGAPTSTVKTPQPVQMLQIGHNWGGNKLKVLESIVNSYQKQHPELKLILQDGYNHDQLLASLQAGKGPDVFFADHVFGEHLLRQGLLGAYCADDQCFECSGSNPPHWCWYGTTGLNDSPWPKALQVFTNGTRQCLEPSAICQSPNPPLWCKFAIGEVNYPEMDLFATPFIWFDGSKKPFPYGIPNNWRVDMVLANKNWLDERGESIPTTSEQLGTLVEKFNADHPIYYTEPTMFDSMFPQLKGIQSSAKAEDAGILVIDSVTLANVELVKSQAIVPLALEGVIPTIWVEGAYLNPSSHLRADALDFMYELREEPMQEVLFQNTGLLPINGNALVKLAEDGSTIGDVIRFAGQVGQLADLQ